MEIARGRTTLRKSRRRNPVSADGRARVAGRQHASWRQAVLVTASTSWLGWYDEQPLEGWDLVKAIALLAGDERPDLSVQRALRREAARRGVEVPQ